MSLLKFNFSPSQSPPDRFRHHAPTGFVVVADERDLWLRKIKQHYLDNNLPLEPGWEARAEDELCRVLPAGMCRYDDGSLPGVTIDVRFTQDDWINGMKVLTGVSTQHMASLLGFSDGPLVQAEEAERRARICAACPANVAVHGCGACVGLADSIVKIRGEASTSSDGSLRQCAVCRCANRAQVWVKTEILARGVTDAQRQQFDMLPFCWKGQALRELQNQPT